ncbi:MAG TPA: alpha/beta hydrolase [Chitinophagaceae bacterium]|nr:alpha/beta hydrolase [Chitinophagaceae bacterium]
MIKKIIQFSFFLLIGISGFTQVPQNGQDSTINNLVHAPGYKTSELGAIPQYVKTGKGKKTLILVPGLGFDASVFKDFMEANKKVYTMYAITIPGNGNTAAPPMPDSGTSYGAQTWNKGIVEGLNKLIEKEKIEKPIIVGHFAQGVQLAVRMAVDHSDKVGGLILLGGPAKFVAALGKKVTEYPLDKMIFFTDNYTGPKWFKHMKKPFFDDNNFAPEIYSLDSAIGNALWEQVAAVPAPVAMRYSSEYFASDVRVEFNKIKCPVLVLRAKYNQKVLEEPINSYLKPQFIDTWDIAPSLNSRIKIIDIENAAGFVWKDKPKEVYNEIKNFVTTIK